MHRRLGGRLECGCTSGPRKNQNHWALDPVMNGGEITYRMHCIIRGLGVKGHVEFCVYIPYNPWEWHIFTYIWQIFTVNVIHSYGTRRAITVITTVTHLEPVENGTWTPVLQVVSSKMWWIQYWWWRNTTWGLENVSPIVCTGQVLLISQLHHQH